MSDAPQEQAATTTLAGLAARIDELTREVRRQGRAAVAAQAAAESCLEKLNTPEPEPEPEDDEDDEDDAPDEAAAASPPPSTEWVRALLPVADALDRMVTQANAMAEKRPPSKPVERKGFLALFAPPPPPPPPDRGVELRALAEGLRVLRAQLATALEGCGVAIDRRTGVAIDPEVHRVVEVRRLRAGERPNEVLEVVRPGYSAGSRMLREAEVVAGESRAPGAATAAGAARAEEPPHE